MDIVQGILGVAWVLPVLIVVILVVIVALYVKSRWKAAKADEALVITGGKNGPSIRVAGGGFVSPFQRYQMFPLGVMTVRSANQETQTKTLIPVVVQWTAQLRPNTDDEATLRSAVLGFTDRSVDDIKESLQQTLDGEIRAVVATLTPEEVVTNKEKFSQDVSSNVQDRMNDLGFKLISLNIAEVNDSKGYYNNLAAKDREEARRAAEVQIADANREVAVAQAASDRISESAKLDRDLAIAEKNQEVTLRKAAIKTETDAADTNARYVGQLAEQDREAELAARRGHVQVVEQQQAQAQAIARREVAVADAETSKREQEIAAEAAARRTEIEAGAQARKSEIDAEAAATVKAKNAKAQADAAIEQARGEAESLNATASAEAEKTRVTGLAQAEVARAQGQAEADATLAKGRADAEAQRLLADALAANDGANLKVSLAQIERDTKIAIYTEYGKVMSTVGEKATFVDMGAGSRSDGSDLFTRVLGNVPRLLKELDVESGALHGKSAAELIGDAVASIRQGGGTQRHGSFAGAETHAEAPDRPASGPTPEPSAEPAPAAPEPAAPEAPQPGDAGQEPSA